MQFDLANLPSDTEQLHRLVRDMALSLEHRDGEIERIPNVIADGQDDGMQTFNMALVKLIKQNIVAQEAAEWASDNPEALKMNLQGIFGSSDRGGISKK